MNGIQRNTNHNTNPPTNSPFDWAPILPRIQEIVSRVSPTLPEDRTYPDLPFHGVKHPADVLERVKEISERCVREGLKIDFEPLQVATLLHDAFGHLNQKDFGCQSPEALAGTASFGILYALGVPVLHAKEVHKIIFKGTDFEQSPETIEQHIIAAADLGSVGDRYEIYTASTDTLHREAEIKSCKTVPFEEWFLRANKHLAQGLVRFIQLTKAATDDDGRSMFHFAALSNLLRKVGEINEETSVVVEVLDDPNIKADLINAFYIGVSPNENDRRTVLRTINSDSLTVRPKYGFCVPGRPSALPVPENSCDKVQASDGSKDATLEYHRVLKPGGKLVFTGDKITIPAEISAGLLPVIQGSHVFRKCLNS